VRLLISTILLTAALCGQSPDCAAAPGTKQLGPKREVNVETLFEYMNGNSEGYFLYGFKSMAGITCEKGPAKLIFDVSEFADFESAYGMFTGNIDPRLPLDAIGAGGQVTPRKGVFVKDKYYVEIAAEPEGEHAAAIREALVNFEKTLPGRTKPPEQIAWFPKDGLQPGSPRLIPQSVLGMKMLKRGYLAMYDNGKAVVVPESSPEAASALLKRLRERIAPESEVKVGDEAYTAQDRYLGRVVFFRKGLYLAGFTNVKDGADAAALAAKLAAGLP
jgi:hypothetical protein